MAAVVVALWLGRRKTGRWNQLAVALGLAAVVVLYAGTIRASGIFLMHRLESPYPIKTPDSMERVDAAMVFGGATMFMQGGEDHFILHPGPRFEAALNLYRAGRADVIVLSGCRTRVPDDPISEGEHLRAEAIRHGVPDASVIVTPLVRTTSDEVEALAAMAKERDWKRVALVTDAFHLGRTMRLVAAAGIEPVAFPSSGLSQPGAQPRVLDWIPSVDGAWYTMRAWHEILGRLVD